MLALLALALSKRVCGGGKVWLPSPLGTGLWFDKFDIEFKQQDRQIIGIAELGYYA